MFQTLYGVNIAVGEVDTSTGSESEEVVAGSGPESSAIPTLRVFSGSLGTLNPNVTMQAFPPGSGPAPGYLGEPRYGLTVAAQPAGEPFNNVTPGGHASSLALLHRLRDAIAGLPDSTSGESAWLDDAYKVQALADIDQLLQNLPSLGLTAILALLSDLETQLQSGLLNPYLAYDLVYDVQRLMAMYQAGAARTGATLAVLPLLALGTPAGVRTSAASPDRAYLLGRDAGPPAVSHEQVLWLQFLGMDEPLERTGTVANRAVSIPDARQYAVRFEHDAPASCPPCPPWSSCGGTCFRVFLDRSHLGSVSMLATQEVAVLSTAGAPPAVLVVTPSLADPARPAKAYVTATEGVALPGQCPAGGGLEGRLLVVGDLDQVPSAPVLVLSHATPRYADLAGSPIVGDPRVFALHACGVDVVDANSDTIQEVAIEGLAGDRLRAVLTSSGKPMLYALESATGTVSAYDLAQERLDTQLTLPMARDLEVSADGSHVVVLTGEDGGRLVLFDAGTMQLDGIVPIGVPGGQGADELQITADGSAALVVDGTRATLEVVWLESESLERRASILRSVASALPDRAMEAPGKRDKLVKDLDGLQAMVAEVEATTDPKARDKAIEKAMESIEQSMSRVDGSLGGDPADDWVVTPEHQAMLMSQARELWLRLSAGLSPSAPQ